jgi:transketolase|tara:strand:- start:22 stop:873 length:852 start_codon:yes stop_codon:yes gene_type:complete
MSKKLNISDLKKITPQVRRDIIRMVHGVQSGHPGGSLGCTDFLVTLFFNLMDKKSSFSMDGKNEDIFFLSNGHISPVFYSVLARSGYFNVEELKTFRKIDSRLQGHPATNEGLPGVRIASGSLGQGLSVAIGAAISKKLNNDSSIVYVLLGDGELQEGQIWEALMYAAHNNINNLIITIDYNGQQIDGPVDEINSLKNLQKKFKSFGWNVVESDGNNIDDIIKTINQAKEMLKKKLPVVNIMKTIMGKGVDFMENSHKWHGIPPDDDQLKNALNQLEETLGDY